MLKILITPEMAADMLTRNQGNRTRRPSVARFYAQQMQAGQWRETHEAIAVDGRGNLVDGQHRLEAIVISGCPQHMWLATYSDDTTATDLPIDLGLRRTAADVLKIDARAAAIVAVIVRRLDRTPQAVATADIRAIYNEHKELIERVLVASASNYQQRTAAAVRAAVFLRCLEFPTVCDQIIDQYSAFCLMDRLDTLWPSVAGLLRKLTSTRTTGGGCEQLDRMLRAWKAFSPINKMLTVIRMSTDKAELEEIRELCEKVGIKRQKGGEQ